MTKRLRIAVFAYEFPALSETFVLNQVTGLIDLGHEVVVVAERRRDDALVHPDVAAYRLDERTVYLDMPRSLPLRAAKAAAIVLRLAIRDPRSLRRCLDVRRFGRLAGSLRLLFWRDRLAGQMPFDAIHAHFGPIGALAAQLREAGVISGPLSTVMHGVDVSAHVHVASGRYDHLFRVGEMFLPVSEFWKAKLEALGCPAERVVVHRMGIDPGRYRFRERCPERYPERGRPLRLLTVGRLVEKKGVADALRAVAALRAHDVPVRYVVAGDGPLRGDLEALAETLGVSDRVEFLGWQDQAAVAALMDEGDILLAPSVTAPDGDQEGIPVTLMEAMASGMLVVSTWHSGIPELVEDGQSGLLVAEHDVAALADTLAALWKEPERWPSISRAARRRVCDDYDIASLNRLLAYRLATLTTDGQRTAIGSAGARMSGRALATLIGSAASFGR